MIVRLEPHRDAARSPRPRVRDVLEAWRRHEQAASESTFGTPAHLLAEAEIDRLSAEYRRLAFEPAQDFQADR